jgi:hypothetical protein
MVAKTIVRYFGAQRVQDPCAGWGGRLLGSIAAGATYVGCDPDPRTAAGLRGILADPSIPAAAREIFHSIDTIANFIIESRNS